MRGFWHTYIVCAGTFVKIGHTQYLLRRLKKLQRDNPNEVHVLFYIEEDVERALHKKFAHLNVRGEWFEYTDEITSFIAGWSSPRSLFDLWTSQNV